MWPFHRNLFHYNWIISPPKKVSQHPGGLQLPLLEIQTQVWYMSSQPKLPQSTSSVVQKKKRAMAVGRLHYRL